MLCSPSRRSHKNLPLYRIAEQTGFTHAEYLNVAFKRETGLTPRGYRQQMAGAPVPSRHAGMSADRPTARAGN
jgi:AraC-like DNA-binding protein